MGDAELKLIEKNESIDLYNMQKVLLDRIKHSFNIQDIIRLALLQTLAPIGDYFSAVEILHKYLGQDKSYRLEIIGAYLTSLWIDNKNEFVSYLLFFNLFLCLLDAVSIRESCKETKYF